MQRPPHLVHVFPTFGIGGMQLRIVSIVNALGAEFQHTFVSLNGERDAARGLKPGIATTVAWPERTKAGPWRLRPFLRALGPDLVLTYNWGAFDALVASTVVPFCPVIHNECGFSVEEAERLKWRRALARRLFLPRAFLTIAVSRKLVDLLIRQVRLDSNKLSFIRTGVDTDRFRPMARAELRLTLGLRANELVFGFLGRLGPEKNVAFLLRAFSEARIPDSKLVIVGSGPEQESLARLAADLGIAGRTLFTGFVEDPSRYFQTMDVFVMSSITEQTPNALLQAMSCGLPCISTDVGDSREILDGEGVVPNGDAARYVAALSAMGASVEKRACLGARNRRRCLNEYSQDKMVANYAKEYRKACFL